MISATVTQLPSRLPFPEIPQMSPRQEKTKNDLLRAMEHIVEDLHGHVHRVADLAVALGRTLQVDDDDIARLGLVGVLHDVGKIHVDPAILSKPGPLDPWELEHMRRHPELGFAMTVDRFDRRVSEAILYHHERYDGRGYPFGLSGMEIPLLARIVLVADAFDAMVSHRSYQPALPVEVAVEEINLHSGTQFDPMVVDAFNHVCETGQLPPTPASVVTP